MKETGGYFELELHKGPHQYHDTPHVLKSGRASLLHILKFTKPSLVHIPYYTCDALLEPFESAGINYRFYEINELLEPAALPGLQPGEYFLYINYLGLKGATVAQLSEKYGDKLIADCTQAFFMKGNGVSWFFNSCRKFFGVPDGSYLYAPRGVEIPFVDTRNENYLTEHLLQRFNGHTNEGYNFFLENETLAGGEVAGISKLSEYLLSHVNYTEVMEKRLENYRFLQERLQGFNLFEGLPDIADVPMCYPLLLDKALNKQAFFAEKIFIPAFWKEVQLRDIAGFELEKSLTDRLLPLPIDHRYSLTDMERIYTTLMSIIK